MIEWMNVSIFKDSIMQTLNQTLDPFNNQNILSLII